MTTRQFYVEWRKKNLLNIHQYAAAYAEYRLKIQQNNYLKLIEEQEKRMSGMNEKILSLEDYIVKYLKK